ncbi:MAG: hypothetical protein JST87_09590 [Bacteroidetes bacterium]|nr:hypothetical protein [Bacteroidota bacterium]
MKKHFLKVLALFAIVFSISQTSFSQVSIGVSVRPRVPVIVRPVPPSPAHVWIDEDWAWRGGRYEYAGGHWAVPPHPGWIWFPGRWRHSRWGWQWVPGRWRRR